MFGLKSNMDRFIDKSVQERSIYKKRLKSNMDRFIDPQEKIIERVPNV